MSKREIMKETGCSEELFKKARLIWLTENALECMLLGEKFENLSRNSLDVYFRKAVAELYPKVEE